MVVDLISFGATLQDFRFPPKKAACGDPTILDWFFPRAFGTKPIKLSGPARAERVDPSTLSDVDGPRVDAE